MLDLHVIYNISCLYLQDLWCTKWIHNRFLHYNLIHLKSYKNRTSNENISNNNLVEGFAKIIRMIYKSEDTNKDFFKKKLKLFYRVVEKTLIDLKIYY